MKIDDFIKRYEIWAEDERIEGVIRDEHRQLAEWLKDYKNYINANEFAKYIM